METNTHQTTPEQDFRFSEFDGVRSKCAQTVTLTQFIGKLRSDRFRGAVEEYRRLKGVPGCEAQAQAVKNRMPCVVPAGICEGGHAVANMRQHSGLVCIDLDHTGNRTSDIKKRLAQLPWVAAAFVSISGEGVKAFARVRGADMEKGYAAVYAAVGEAVSRHVGHPYDVACRTLTQPCFYSWDSDAYYHPEAGEFTMPEAANGDAFAVTSAATAANAPHVATDALSSASAPSASVPSALASSAPSSSVEACGMPWATSASSAPSSAASSDDRPFRFLQRFDRLNPFVRGKRNGVCLALGRQARSNFFSQKEVEKIIAVYAGRYAVADFTENDIRQRVMAGYQYVANVEGRQPSTTGGQQGSGFTYEPFSDEGEGEDDTDVLYKNDRLRAEAPCIPDEVYGLLHPFFARCVKYASKTRERDVLLLGSILACSALLPNVTFFYKDRLCSPHFYLAVVAPAGTGKGVLSFSNSLIDCTDEYYAGLRRQLRKQYDEALLAWDEEQGKARKERRKPDIALKPEEPRPQYFKISATTSKSRLIESLAASGNIGCVMTSTEIITLASAIRQDCGAFDDILLKAFHHEEVSSSYKGDGEPLVARHPCLGVCLSGTQEQFAALFRSLETGLYSRFAFYTRARELQWESCAPGTGSVDQRNYFRGLSEEMLAMHKGLLQSPTYVSFTAGQWEEHTRCFGALIEKAEAEGRDSVTGIIFRCGLQVMRIAATFTVFRKWDDYRFAKEYVCTDGDFKAAMLIGRTLLEHSLLLCTSLPDSLQKPVPMHRFYRMDETLAALPPRFSFSEFVTKAQEMGVSRSTAKRMLKNAVKRQVVDKEDNSYSKRETAPGKGS